MPRRVLNVPAARPPGAFYSEPETLTVWLRNACDPRPVYHDLGRDRPDGAWWLSRCGLPRTWPVSSEDRAAGVRIGEPKGIIVPLRLVHAAARPCARCWP